MNGVRELPVALTLLCIITFTAPPHAQQAQPGRPAPLPPSSTSSTVPRSVPFNGQLMTPAGDVRTGSVMLTCGLYPDQKDGTPIWTEQQLVALDADGRYSVSYIQGLGGSLVFKPSSGDAHAMVLLSGSGNVGIGTSTPTSRLTVRGADSSGSSVAFQAENASGAFALRAWDRTVPIGALLGSSESTAAVAAPLQTDVAALRRENAELQTRLDRVEQALAAILVIQSGAAPR